MESEKNIGFQKQEIKVVMSTKSVGGYPGSRCAVAVEDLADNTANPCEYWVFELWKKVWIM